MNEGQNGAETGRRGGFSRILGSRRVRADDVAGVPGDLPSGRVFVVASVFTLAALVLSLFVAFRQWKSRHDEWAAYGAFRVAPVILPLANRVPRGIAPEEWSRVVGQARRMLAGLTASGVLDIQQMRELRSELQRQVDAAEPAAAGRILDTIWYDLERRAGPALTRAPRFALAGSLHPLSKARVDRAPADDSLGLALARTRAMLVALAADGNFSADGRRALREALDAQIQGSSGEDFASAIEAVWSLAASVHEPPAGYTRPRFDSSPATE